MMGHFMGTRGKSRGGVPGQTSHGTMIAIHIPKGTNVMPINKSASELILPRGMEYEVTKNELMDVDDSSERVPSEVTEKLSVRRSKGTVRKVHLKAIPKTRKSKK